MGKVSTLQIHDPRTFPYSRVWSLRPKFICKMAAIAAAHNQSENGPPTSSSCSVHLLGYHIARLKLLDLKMAASNS
jgi:hypothetical protein